LEAINRQIKKAPGRIARALVKHQAHKGIDYVSRKAKEAKMRKEIAKATKVNRKQRVIIVPF
jgi:hypothetical protein